MKSFVSLIILIVLAGCNGRLPAGQSSFGDSIVDPTETMLNEEARPILTFEKSEHDFGRIAHDEVVSYHFKFINTGQADLVISSAKASCGCTVPDYSKDPVAPGQSGTIEVKFDAHGKSGFQHKTISILANTVPNTSEIAIKAMIETTENQ